MTRKIFVTLLCLLVLAGTVQAQDPGTSVPVDTGRDPAYQTLSTSNVYVDPRVQGVDVQTLEQAAMQAQGNPHTQVKIAVLSSLPPAYLTALDQSMARDASLAGRVRGRERDFYAFQLHKALNLDKEPLVLVSLQGRSDGVTVWTTALDAPERKRLADAAAPRISVNPTQGTAELAQAVASDINGREYRSSAGLWLVFRTGRVDCRRPGPFPPPVGKSEI